MQFPTTTNYRVKFPGFGEIEGGQQNAMDEIHLGKTTFLIMVSSFTGKYIGRKFAEMGAPLAGQLKMPSKVVAATMSAIISLDAS